jgi:hypothetical protein
VKEVDKMQCLHRVQLNTAPFNLAWDGGGRFGAVLHQIDDRAVDNLIDP